MKNDKIRKWRFPAMTGQSWLWFGAAALLPVAVIMFLYSQNMSHYEEGAWLVIVSVALLAVSAVGWFSFCLIFRSLLSATLSTAICWVFFFASNLILDEMLIPLGVSDNGLLLILGAALIIAFCTGFVFRKYPSTAFGGVFSLSVVSLVLLINVGSILLYGQKDEDTSDYIKSVFNTETSSPKPNIYWFHCDGMLGFSSMETYFNDSQEEFAAELEARGFTINQNAAFEGGHNTKIALPCLMSPYAYDHWISSKVATYEDIARVSGTSQLTFLSFRVHNELVAAFEQGGYTTAVQPYEVYLLPVAEKLYYDTDNGVQKITQNTSEDGFFETRQQLIQHCNRCDFLDKCSAFFAVVVDMVGVEDVIDVLSDPSVPKELTAQLSENELLQLGLSENGAKEVSWTAHTIYDLLQSNSKPHFSILWCFYAHSPYAKDENGNRTTDEDNLNISDYPAQHRFTAKVLLNLVDMILREDPNAVIVLQGDHGLHNNTKDDFEKYFGKSGIELDLWNQVMSAVRVPEKYQNGEEHYALENPLNISRYLVNSFVGRNYEYLE